MKCLTAIIIALTCLTWSAHAKYNCSDIKPNRTSKSHESQKAGLWREPFSGMEFVKVFGGCFQMGQTREDKHQIINVRGKKKYLKYFSEEQPRHEVCLDDFWLGRFEVTNKQFRQFRPEYSNKDYEGKNINSDNQPAVYINWNDAQAFAKWLSEKTGKRFRLPTEAEWEYACRAGTTTVRFWGDDPSDACRYANTHDVKSKKENNIHWLHHFCDDGYTVTAPVGSFQPNGFGLYDMLGNVWEWCQDVYHKEAYHKHTSRNPIISHGGDFRIIRGGSWVSAPAYVRCAVRYKLSTAVREYVVGFRLVADK